MGKAKSDPYVTFKVDPPEMAFFDLKGRQTEVISQDLDPAWERKILLSLKATTPEDLAGASLRLTINDHDTFSFDDTMGVVILSLEDICRKYAAEGKFAFSEPVIHYGQHAGTLQGEIIVRDPGTGEPDSPEQAPTTGCAVSECQVLSPAPTPAALLAYFLPRSESWRQGANAHLFHKFTRPLCRCFLYFWTFLFRCSAPSAENARTESLYRRPEAPDSPLPSCTSPAMGVPPFLFLVSGHHLSLSDLALAGGCWLVSGWG